MEFSFNLQNNAKPYRYLRIDLSLYKFTSPNGSVFKIDFVKSAFEHEIIEIENYKAYQIKISGMFETHKTLDKNWGITLLEILRDFHGKRIRKEAFLFKDIELLSRDIYELKSKMPEGSLNHLFADKDSTVLTFISEI